MLVLHSCLEFFTHIEMLPDAREGLQNEHLQFALIWPERQREVLAQNTHFDYILISL